MKEAHGFVEPIGIDLNEEFMKALRLMEETEKNVLVTGKAGTGKSTLLNYFTDKTRKGIAVLAPTGVAAVNVNGQTIHSFFNFRPDITISKVREARGERERVLQELDALVIDEASMLRADLLDCVDKTLRLNRREKTPFGGVQMIFFGDLYQLPPVIMGKERRIFEEQYESPYFFDAPSFRNTIFELVELEKVYRQKDESFISILNAIRNNTIEEKEMRNLNSRYRPQANSKENELCITLTTTNDLADEINEHKLSTIRAPLREYRAIEKGELGKERQPASELLRIKKGSQVMLLNNDPMGRWVNGTMGAVTGFNQEIPAEETITVRLQQGNEVEVTTHTWKVFEYFYNENKSALDSRTIGSFTQYPLKLAWAVTIHKSQGKTFDRVHVDIGRGVFTPGQLYVALSRCRTLEGITLEKRVEKKHVYADWRVVKFATGRQYEISEKLMPIEQKTDALRKAIRNKERLEIVYLKANDVKSKRFIQPLEVGEMEYLTKKYLGVRAYCFKRKGERMFRVDRILEIH